MECVRAEGFMEGEPGCCASADGCHREDEIRCRAKARAEYPEAAGGKSKLGDVYSVVGYLFRVKE